MGTVSSIASSSTERDVEDNSSFRLGPLPSAHSDVTSTLPPPPPTHTHVDVISDAGSRPSFVTSFFRRSVHRVRRLSPSPSGETDTGSDITRNDGQKGDSADVKRKETQLAHPAMLDLKQAPVLLHSNHFSSRVLWTRRTRRPWKACAALMHYSVALGLIPLIV